MLKPIFKTRSTLSTPFFKIPSVCKRLNIGCNNKNENENKNENFYVINKFLFNYIYATLVLSVQTRFTLGAERRCDRRDGMSSGSDGSGLCGEAVSSECSGGAADSCELMSGSSTSCEAINPVSEI